MRVSEVLLNIEYVYRRRMKAPSHAKGAQRFPACAVLARCVPRELVDNGKVRIEFTEWTWESPSGARIPMLAPDKRAVQVTRSKVISARDLVRAADSML